VEETVVVTISGSGLAKSKKIELEFLISLIVIVLRDCTGTDRGRTYTQTLIRILSSLSHGRCIIVVCKYCAIKNLFADILCNVPVEPFCHAFT